MPTNNPFMPTSGSSRPAPAPSPAGAPLPGGASDSFEVDLTDVEYPMFVWDFELLEGDGKGRVLKVFTAITPAAMWKVAETVIALGVGQTGEVVKFSRSDVVGKDCGVTVADSEYNGNVRSQIQRVVSLAELEQLKAQA